LILVGRRYLADDEDDVDDVTKNVGGFREADNDFSSFRRNDHSYRSVPLQQNQRSKITSRKSRPQPKPQTVPHSNIRPASTEVLTTTSIGRTHSAINLDQASFNPQRRSSNKSCSKTGKKKRCTKKLKRTRSTDFAILRKIDDEDLGEKSRKSKHSKSRLEEDSDSWCSTCTSDDSDYERWDNWSNERSFQSRSIRVSVFNHPVLKQFSSNSSSSSNQSRSLYSSASSRRVRSSKKNCVIM